MDGIRRTSSRRDFLKLAGASSMAALLAACGGGAPAAAPTAAPAAGGARGAPAADTTATLTILISAARQTRRSTRTPTRASKRSTPTSPSKTTSPPSPPGRILEQDHHRGGRRPLARHHQHRDRRRAAVGQEGAAAAARRIHCQRPERQRADRRCRPGADRAFKIDGKTWQIPHSWNNMVIYYNTKMFKDAGIDPPKPDWTWDDFLGIAKKLTTGSGADQGLWLRHSELQLRTAALVADQRHHPAHADWTDSNLNDPEGG